MQSHVPSAWRLMRMYVMKVAMRLRKNSRPWLAALCYIFQVAFTSLSTDFSTSLEGSAIEMKPTTVPVDAAVSLNTAITSERNIFIENTF